MIKIEEVSGVNARSGTTFEDHWDETNFVVTVESHVQDGDRCVKYNTPE